MVCVQCPAVSRLCNDGIPRGRAPARSGLLQCCSAAVVPPVLHTPAATPLRLPHTHPGLIDNLILSQLPPFTKIIAFKQ